VIVRFVHIGGIIDHHCLNFRFVNLKLFCRDKLLCDIMVSIRLECDSVSGWVKTNYKFGICYFSNKYAAWYKWSTDWLAIASIMCPSRVLPLSADCCFCELVPSKFNRARWFNTNRKHRHLVNSNLFSPSYIDGYRTLGVKQQSPAHYFIKTTTPTGSQALVARTYNPSCF